MEKTGIEPPEEEEEERPVVNGNGMAVTPGQFLYPIWIWILFYRVASYFIPQLKGCSCWSRSCISELRAQDWSLGLTNNHFIAKPRTNHLISVYLRFPFCEMVIMYIYFIRLLQSLLSKIFVKCLISLNNKTYKDMNSPKSGWDWGNIECLGW